ncbi:DUF72 domain-containing protein [Candidatus Bipolaricaulota bacterium]
MNDVRIGTCSWNYPSWEGLIYESHDKTEYLAEYAKRLNAVEIDRWFWSLFEDPMKVRLPLEKDAAVYRESVPDSFRFGVKAPNSVTLTHLYKQDRSSKTEPLVENPHFLSHDLTVEFLDRIKPLHEVLGPVMFQFEYLNKKKMPSSAEFADRFGAFADDLPQGFMYAVETRNKDYVTREFYEFLLEHTLCPALVSGYWMPRISSLFAEHKELLCQFPVVVIRLMGEDRGEMEKATAKQWNRIVKPHDVELDKVSEMLLELRQADVTPFVFVNNHYEGSAPITIDRLMERLTPKNETS